MTDTKDKKALADLILWADNYNHNDVMGIARSIRRYGFNNAPRLWRGVHVRGGNHTVMALRLLKAEGPKPDQDRTWPPENITVKDDDWYVDWIDISHLPEAESIEFAHADNQWARNAAPDPEKVLSYLQSIADPTIIETMGYGQDAIEQLEAELESIILGDIGEDLPDDTQTEDADVQTIPEQYIVMIECDDETQQTTLLERLMGEGYTCRALVS